MEDQASYDENEYRMEDSISYGEKDKEELTSYGPKAKEGLILTVAPSSTDA